jgi:integrase
MAVFKKGKKGIYHYDFWYLGRRVQGSTNTTRKTLAQEVENNKRKELQQAYAGLPAEDPKDRIRTVAACIATHIANLGCSESTVTWTKERLAHVKRLLGDLLLPVPKDAIRGYMRKRAKEGAGPRTQNMEVDLLARAIGYSWKVLWPKVNRNKEPKDKGIALTPEQEVLLLGEVARVRSRDFETYVRLLLLAPMRPDKEAARMKWKHINFAAGYLMVAESKTAAGEGRIITMNDELASLVKSHAERHVLQFGTLDPEHYLFPKRRPAPADPTQHVKSFRRTWERACERAGIKARRYDCRHTVITKLAEGESSDSTIMALAGHLSRKMLEHYSHIRMEAKRKAMESVRTAIPIVLNVPAASQGVPAKVPAPAPRLARNGFQVIEGNGGRDRTRTCDLLRVKQAL